MIKSNGASDTPIAGKKNDELRRYPFAERFARLVTTFSGNDRSNIFALYGEWGSGKTSVWNMVKGEIAKMQPQTQTLEFSPWAYSSEDRILSGFFHELLADLGRKPVLGQVAHAFHNLSESLSAAGSAGLMAAGADPSGATSIYATGAIVGGRAAKKIAEAAKASETRSLGELHAQVAKELVKAKRPILIMVDDVDRLPPAQIAALFQLARVNASLPMVNYLFLMDRTVIEEALTKLGFPRTFLEKIIQFGVDLPRSAPEDLHAMAASRVFAALTPAERTTLGPRIEVAIKTAEAVLDTPRSIVRVAESFRFHLEFFRDGNVLEVDLVDLFFLEILRCQAPAIYAFIRDETGTYIAEEPLLPYLTGEADKTKSQRKEKLATVLAKQSEYPAKVLEDIFTALVPNYLSAGRSSQEDFAQCRLCSAPHFRNFFELTAPREHPSQAQLEEVRSSKPQRATNALVHLLIERYGWDAAITALDAKYSRESDPTLIKSLSTALWVADLGRLREIGPGAAILPMVGIANLTINLLRRVPDLATREKILREVRFSSHHFGLLYRVVVSEQNAARQPGLGYSTIFSAVDLRRLRRECLEEADKLLNGAEMMSEPMLVVFLAYKSEAQGPDIVRAWTAGLLCKPERLAGLLKNVIRMHRRGPPEEKLVLTRALLAFYFTIDQALVDATKDTSRLEAEGAEVLQQAHKIAGDAESDSIPSNDPSTQLMPLVPNLI